MIVREQWYDCTEWPLNLYSQSSNRLWLVPGLSPESVKSKQQQTSFVLILNILREEMVSSSNLKQNFAEKFSSLKFPITIEPLVCLYTISVGLNEVRESLKDFSLSKNLLHINHHRSSDPIWSLTKSAGTNWTSQRRSAFTSVSPLTLIPRRRSRNTSPTMRRSTAPYPSFQSKSQGTLSEIFSIYIYFHGWILFSAKQWEMVGFLVANSNSSNSCSPSVSHSLCHTLWHMKYFQYGWI